MRFYKNLWVGKQAAGKKWRILWSLKHFRPLKDVFVLILARTPHDLIHIYPSEEFLQPYYKKRSRDLFVIGIACGKQEALELVCRIVEEVYRETGGCDIRRYIKLKAGKGSDAVYFVDNH